MCWWLAIAKKKMWLWIVSFGESYNGDVLQLAEQIFSLSLPQMTKYCVMRECENIHSWISLVGDLVFSHQGEIYGFKFPKRFLEISSRERSHSFLNSFLNPNLKTRLPIHWYPFPLHSQGLMPCKQQPDILTGQLIWIPIVKFLKQSFVKLHC
jgi:hypothetical protein